MKYYRQGNDHPYLEIKMETNPDRKAVHETMQGEFRRTIETSGTVPFKFPGVAGTDFFHCQQTLKHIKENKPQPGNIEDFLGADVCFRSQGQAGR